MSKKKQPPKNDFGGKHFYIHAQALDNRAILRITDKRTMKTNEFEVGYDGSKPFFIEPKAEVINVDLLDLNEDITPFEADDESGE